MIQFLLKGILRDKSRSILPVIIVAIGVSLTVLLSGYIKGAFDDMTDQNARFDTGHVKIMTKAYADNKDQLPNDLALLNITELKASLTENYPEMKWVERIKFGGLIDAPDKKGNSKGQGPAFGTAIDFLKPGSDEVKRMNIQNALVTGKLPAKNREAIIGDDFSKKLNIEIGDEVTFFGTTMNGSMAFQNFNICGTIKFGAASLDKGAILIDIADAQFLLDMEDGAGELLGYQENEVYNDQAAAEIAESFNAKYKNSNDEFAPVMYTLKKQNGLEEILDYANLMSGIFVFIFVGAMSVVLWNTGLLGGLRRYQEFGIRLALGESKGKIYRSLIMEAVLVGFIGSIVGTLFGLAGTYYLQVVGIDITDLMEDSTMLMPSTIRAKITPELFYIGFIPGLLATVLGNMLSGIGIYQRETANLFKELEV